jgi:hypothetical protein
MGHGLRPLNITAAALLTQLLLLVGIFFGAAILKRGDVSHKYRPLRVVEPLFTPLSPLPWLVGVLALVTLVPLSLSDDFTPLVEPMLGGLALPSIAAGTSRLVMFLTDILIIGLVVFLTGGSRQSPFTAIFFILPALAIFLREPSSHLVLYLLLVSTWFTVGMGRERLSDEIVAERALVVSYWFVAIYCLALTTFVAYVTRPQ